MKKFPVEIREYPARRTAGVMVRTSMGKAAEDCSALWRRTFGPRMEQFPADPALPGESYGVSLMLDQDNFDYWAVMPLAPGAAVPAGMQALDLPGGLYATCRVDSLAELGNAFTYIYGEWNAKGEGYAIDFSRPCYELYNAEFLQTGALVVCCPVVAN